MGGYKEKNQNKEEVEYYYHDPPPSSTYGCYSRTSKRSSYGGLIRGVGIPEEESRKSQSRGHSSSMRGKSWIVALVLSSFDQ